jgi:hypothetical protein
MHPEDAAVLRGLLARGARSEKSSDRPSVPHFEEGNKLINNQLDNT